MLDSLHADFGVALYTTSHERADPSTWDYGHPFDPDWQKYPASILSPARYVEGTLVVDVVALRPLRPLRPLRHIWRGEAVAQLTNDPMDDVQALARAATMVIARFPMAVAPVIAAQR